MQAYYETTPHRAESIRLFHVIQEKSANPQTLLTADAISKFLGVLGINSQHNTVKLLHRIDKEGKQMNQEYWGICISKALEKVPLDCENQLGEFHEYLKYLLGGTFYQPLAHYEKWDENSMKSSDAKSEAYATILAYCSDLSLYIQKMEFVVFQANLYKINVCFSLATLYPEKSQEIIEIYEQILKGNFLENLQYSLTLNFDDSQILAEIMKSLCYLYLGLKYERVRRLLESSFLLNKQILKGLLQNLDDKRIEIRYYSCVLSALISSNVPEFPLIVLKDNQYFLSMAKRIAGVSEEEGLEYALEFLTTLITEIGKNKLAEQQKFKDILSNIFNFGMAQLKKSKKKQTQAICINLASECVKATNLKQADLKVLKIVNNVFENAHIEENKPLVLATLNVLRNSLLYQREEVRSVMINDKNFIKYYKRVLSESREAWEPFLQILQISVILSRSQNVKILFEKDLISYVFTLCSSTNGCAKFYLSEIILNLVKKAIESQWQITYLYQKLLIKTVGQLLRRSFDNDEVLAASYGTGQVKYFAHKQVFINCMKSLYMLSAPIMNQSSGFLKRELYIKYFSAEFSYQFAESLRNYFQMNKNDKYLNLNLREEQQIENSMLDSPRLSMYQLINLVIDEMTMDLRKRNVTIDILKQVHRMRHEYLESLYRILSFHELEVKSIPIYLKIAADVERGQVIRQRTHRLTWNQFRSCLAEAAKKCLGIEVGFFRIKEKSEGFEIRHDEEYRRFVEKVLYDYPRSNFNIEVSVFDIQEKTDFREQTSTGSMQMNRAQNDLMRVRTENRDVPRFMSYRMPEVRDVSPYGSRRVYNPNGRGSSPRSRSPAFNYVCLKCRKPTINRSQICNECVLLNNFNR